MKPRILLALALGSALIASGCGPGRATPEHPGGAASHAPDADTPPYAAGQHGAVASAELQASRVGLAILKRGGNAVDAAIAVAFALGVTHPSAANIGGGGFMLVRAPDGAVTAIDYREVAPLAAHADMFLDAAGNVTDLGQRGPLAAGIPGVVAGLAYAHQRFGTLPWAELIAPAIALARDGARVDAPHAEELGWAVDDILAYASDTRERSLTVRSATVPALQAAQNAALDTFRKPDGSRYREGDTWRQPELARTLETIARDGADAFYRGALAEALAAGVRAMGGIWTREDLASYAAIERRPIAFTYHGHEVYSMPPPSAGGIVLQQALTAAELLSLDALPWESPQRIHLFAEIMRRAYADRNELLGDPAFVDAPLERLVDRAYVAERVADIDREHATPSAKIKAGFPPSESRHTTHFSVADARGFAVANTFTLNTDFGALVQVPGTGVTLNNEMDDFTAKPGAPNAFGLVQAAANAIAPGKRMLSSMTPTIVTRGGKLRAVLGSPGGPTITTTVAQILMQLVDHGRSLREAVAAPRVHHQWWPDAITVEAAVPAATRAALRGYGHALEEEPSLGHAHCIELDPVSGELRAVADITRGGGGAVAY